jgi:hypothetical protein
MPDLDRRSKAKTLSGETESGCDLPVTSKVVAVGGRYVGVLIVEKVPDQVARLVRLWHLCSVSFGEVLGEGVADAPRRERLGVTPRERDEGLAGRGDLSTPRIRQRPKARLALRREVAESLDVGAFFAVIGGSCFRQPPQCQVVREVVRVGRQVGVNM